MVVKGAGKRGRGWLQLMSVGAGSAVSWCCRVVGRSDAGQSEARALGSGKGVGGRLEEGKSL